jgi:hypothetical protein
MSELERALVALGRDLDVPEAPDLVGPVLARIERPPPRVQRATRRRVALAVALVLAAALAATLAIPDARSAFLRVITFGGEEIHLVEELPEVPPSPAELDLDVVLGRPVTLDRARAAAGFPLQELEEEPDRVYLGKRGTVWFLYGSPQRIRLLVAQTPRAEIDEEYIVKKLATAGTVVDRLEVDGVPALLLSGEPHVVALVDESGELIQESTRLAQNVLLWEEDDVAIRLEGAFSRDEALELAAALR